MLNYIETPVREMHQPFFEEKGVRVVIKREDLNHPEVSGNKWWKLKYNLKEALDSGHKTLLTFGGAYSNHIYSTGSGTGSWTKEHWSYPWGRNTSIEFDFGVCNFERDEVALRDA